MGSTLKFVGSACQDLRRVIRPVLVFALLWTALGSLFAVPLLSWMLRRLASGGQFAVTNYDLVAALLRPAGIGLILMVAVGWIGLWLGQQAGFQQLAVHAQAQRPVSGFLVWRWVLGEVPQLAKLAAMVLVRLLGLVVPMTVALGWLYLRLPGGHDINYYLAIQPPEWKRTLQAAAAVVAFGGLIAGYLVLRWMFALPDWVATGRPVTESFRRSWTLTRGRMFSFAAPILLWVVLWLAGSLSVAGLYSALSKVILNQLGGELARIALALVFIEAVALVGGTLASTLASAVTQLIAARVYASASLAADRESRRPELQSPTRVLPGRFLTVAGLVGGLVVSGALTVRHLSRIQPAKPFEVTAHRGGARAAPENSLSALRQAIADGADYAEIDVQTTRDGQVVLWHDADFMRAARDPRRVGDATLAQLKTIDVGKSFSPQFTGEPIATLEEAIEVAGDRLRLNVELKYYGEDPALAPRVARVLRQHDFLSRSVVTSLKAQALEQFRVEAPELPVGLIVTAAMGSVARLPVEFLSVNTRQARAELFRQAQQQGKAVHVWTVNDVSTALRLVHLGADNLITDEPARLVALRHELEELDDLERLALALRLHLNR